jgi:hypothetical protein
MHICSSMNSCPRAAACAVRPPAPARALHDFLFACGCLLGCCSMSAVGPCKPMPSKACRRQAGHIPPSIGISNRPMDPSLVRWAALVCTALLRARIAWRSGRLPRACMYVHGLSLLITPCFRIEILCFPTHQSASEHAAGLAITCRTEQSSNDRIKYFKYAAVWDLRILLEQICTEWRNMLCFIRRTSPSIVRRVLDRLYYAKKF